MLIMEHAIWQGALRMVFNYNYNDTKDLTEYEQRILRRLTGIEISLDAIATLLLMLVLCVRC